MSKMLRFGVKVGITSATVYLTVNSGVWKDNETTSELYYKIKEKVTPYIEPAVNQIPFELPELPKTGDVCSSAKTAWNKGVMASCIFLSEFSDNAWDYTKKGIMYGYEKIQEQMEPTEKSKT